MRKGINHIVNRIADGVTRRRDVMPLQERLGEALARLQPRCRLGRPKNWPAAGGELIHQTQG